MVGEARPREGMLGAHTEPGRAIQGCSALCRPVERQRATAALPRCRRAWDTQDMTGEEVPQHSLHIPNVGSTGDLMRFCGPGGAPREIVAPRQLQDTDVHPVTEAPAMKLLPNQKYYIDPKLLGLTPGNLHTWKLG